jgi:hypothetical protein
MAEKSHVLKREVVQQSLAALRQLKVHRTFAGYLCLRETARATNRRTQLKPDFAGFFDRYLKIGDASAAAPYAVPFNDRGAFLWFNRNVAGSYAPSSLRDVSPLRQVADIFGSRADHTFSLKEDDAKLCFVHLLHKKQMPVLPLAAFLFRDYAIEEEDGEGAPVPADLIAVFRDQFGFRAADKSEDADFKVLFDAGSFAQSVTFEELK